jgi:hypothetical protein
MGLPVNDKNKNKTGNKNQKNNQGGSKFIAKPGTKGANTTRPQRTGGTRGS